MEFRPCIDIHNGKVKQIVGSSLKDEGDSARDNFVATRDADYYSQLYREKNLRGGHVILLNSVDSQYYEATKEQAFKALGAYPGGLQVGGGITADNASEYIEAGASHVIVTSFVFRNGIIDYERLKDLVQAVGKDRIVLDLSCRKKGDDYYIVTDRWQKWTDEKLDEKLLNSLAAYCDEYLVHAVDVEGKGQGIDEQVLSLLARFSPIPVTYAGGVHSIEDVLKIKKAGNGLVNVTVGSALDIFGGDISIDEIVCAL